MYVGLQTYNLGLRFGSQSQVQPTWITYFIVPLTNLFIGSISNLNQLHVLYLGRAYNVFYGSHLHISPIYTVYTSHYNTYMVIDIPQNWLPWLIRLMYGVTHWQTKSTGETAHGWSQPKTETVLPPDLKGILTNDAVIGHRLHMYQSAVDSTQWVEWRMNVHPYNAWRRCEKWTYSVKYTAHAGWIGLQISGLKEKLDACTISPKEIPLLQFSF